MAKKSKKPRIQRTNIDVSALIDNENIVQGELTGEIERSMLGYSVLTILDRALPDARDGMKPVQRRILYCCKERGYDKNKHYVKNAKIVGDTIGSYHPHGSCYGTITNMSQPWAMRYPLIDFQGNNGSLDGDSPAAYRYTEGRLDNITYELLEDVLDKQSVAFRPNYDETTVEPVVLPGLLPNFLLNGATGIAVGYTTKTPSHNIGELCDGIAYYVKHRDATVDELMNYIKGPDMPCGSIMLSDGIRDLYENGFGKLAFRANYEVEENTETGNPQVVFVDVPPESNKPKLIEKIADLISAKKIPRTLSVRDESRGMNIRIVVECHKTARISDVVADLYEKTFLQKNESYIMRAVVGPVPRTLSLVNAIELYVDHRVDVIRNQRTYANTVLNSRIVTQKEQLYIADHKDLIRDVIKTCDSVVDAKHRLTTELDLDEDRADRVVKMSVGQIIELNPQKFKTKIAELEAEVAENTHVLTDSTALDDVIVAQLVDVKRRFNDDRRTTIVDEFDDEHDEVDVDNDNVRDVICVSTAGKVKVYNEAEFGEFVARKAIRDKQVVFAQVHAGIHSDVVTVVRDDGTCVRSTVKLFEANFDRIDGFVGMFTFSEASTKSVLIVLDNGCVKKTPLAKFKFKDGREAPAVKDLGTAKVKLIRVVDDSEDDVVTLATAKGYIGRFSLNSFTSSSMNARCMPTCKLDDGDHVVDCVVTKRGADVGSKLVLFGTLDSGDPVVKVVDFSTVTVKGRTARALPFTREKRFGELSRAIVTTEPTVTVYDDKNNVVSVNLAKLEVRDREKKFDNFNKVVSSFTMGSYEKPNAE